MNLIIETDRLYCTPFNENDFKLLYDLHNSNAVLKSTADGRQSKEEILAHLNHFINIQEEKKYSQWKFYEKETNRFIGRGGIDFKQFDPASEPQPELRFALHEEFWGQGYATEIAKSSLDWAFNTIQLAHVVGTCYENNTASIKIFNKFKFKKIKIIKYKGLECPYFILSKESYLKIRNP